MSSFDAADADRFEPGSRVQPRSGEFVEYIGTVVEARSGMVIVEYEVFGQKVPVEHHPEDLNRRTD